MTRYRQRPLLGPVPPTGTARAVIGFLRRLRRRFLGDLDGLFFGFFLTVHRNAVFLRSCRFFDRLFSGFGSLGRGEHLFGGLFDGLFRDGLFSRSLRGFFLDRFGSFGLGGGFRRCFGRFHRCFGGFLCCSGFGLCCGSRLGVGFA
jgi:hypothetical protein